MSYDWQLACVGYRINSLRAEISRVADKDHPYPEPRRIYAALLAVVASREKVLRDAQSFYSKSEAGARGLRKTIEEVASELEDVAYLFELSHRVDSARI